MKKANVPVTSISRIVPNISSSRNEKKKYHARLDRNLLHRTQRKMLLKVTSECRTVLSKPLLVITVLISTDPLIHERHKVYVQKIRRKETANVRYLTSEEWKRGGQTRILDQLDSEQKCK